MSPKNTYNYAVEHSREKADSIIDHEHSATACVIMIPPPLNVSRTLENIWKRIKEGIKAAKAL